MFCCGISINMTIEQLNALSQNAACAEFARCCGAPKWAAHLTEMRPYADAESVYQESEIAFDELERDDWLAAFSHHPRIGDVDALRAKFSTLAATKEWAGGEQSGTRQASEQTLRALSKRNAEYENKFDHVFIVCATGKSADEMLSILESRLPNESDTELDLAATEQRKITRLRLEKLLAA